MDAFRHWHILQSSGMRSQFSAISDDLFPKAWAEHTPVGWLGLKVDATYPCLVTIFLHQQGQASKTISEKSCPSGQTIIPLAPATECGDRLSYTLTVDGQECHSSDDRFAVSWVCNFPPRRVPKLAVVICTCNRELQLQMLIAQLIPQINDVEICVLVNQGQAGLERRLSFAAVDQKFLIVEQENLGGAGGFTRGIMEALALPDITHVVLLDDDVQIDQGLFARLKSALVYVDPSTCIGGAMVDIERRDRIISLGHNFDADCAVTQDRVPPAGALLDDPETMIQLENPSRVDFCGWWCFCFPREAVDRCGLPLPLFIRGDDAEYGLRLARNGFHTIMWPGIYIYHPYLPDQSLSWHHFYGQRNALFCSHLALGRRSSRAVHRALRGVINALVLYRYDEAHAGIAALNAYLQGAKALDTWSSVDHKALLKHNEVIASTSGGDYISLPLYKSPLMRTVVTTARLVGDALRLTDARPQKIITVTVSSWKPGTIKRPGCIVTVRGRNSILLRRNPKRLRIELTLFLRLIVGLFLIRSYNNAQLLQLGTYTWWNERLRVRPRSS